MSAPWEAFAPPDNAPAEEKGPWSSFTPPAAPTDEHGPWEPFAQDHQAKVQSLVSSGSDAAISHAAANPDDSAGWEAYQHLASRPMGEKFMAGVRSIPETAVNAGKGLLQFAAGVPAAIAHSAVGGLQNLDARINSAIGADSMAENLAQRATTNKAESVLAEQRNEEGLKNVGQSIARTAKWATGNQDLRQDFDQKVQHARNLQQLEQGRPLDTGAVAWLERNTEGANPSEQFGPEALQRIGAQPVNPETTALVGAGGDPMNAAMMAAGSFPGANRIAGTALKGVGGAGEAAASGVANAIKSAATSRMARHFTVPGIAADALFTGGAHMATAATAAATGGASWVGAKLAQGAFGAAKEAGGEMLGALPPAGQGFFRSVLKEGIKGGAGTAVGMLPLNIAQSEGDPGELAKSETSAGVFGAGMGAASGAVNARRIGALGQFGETVKAGEAMNFNDPADAAHQAVMAQLPQASRDLINFTRGSFDGATTPDGKPIRVQAVDDATFQQQAGQSSRGVYFDDGTLLVNAGRTNPDGTFTPKSPEALHETLAHEAKHAIDQAQQAAQPELYRNVFDGLRKQFTTDGTNPTPEFQQWIDGQLQLHADNLKQAGVAPEEIAARLGRFDTNYWLNEASADIGQGLVTGKDLGGFMLPQSLAGKVWDAVRGAAQKAGIALPENTTGALGIPQAAEATRAIRQQLYAAGAESRARRDANAASLGTHMKTLQDRLNAIPEITTGMSAAEAEKHSLARAAIEKQLARWKSRLAGQPEPDAQTAPQGSTNAATAPLNRYRIAAILRQQGLNADEAKQWAGAAEGATDEDAVVDALKRRAEMKYLTTKPTVQAEAPPAPPQVETPEFVPPEVQEQAAQPPPPVPPKEAPPTAPAEQQPVNVPRWTAKEVRPGVWQVVDGADNPKSKKTFPNQAAAEQSIAKIGKRIQLANGPGDLPDILNHIAEMGGIAKKKGTQEFDDMPTLHKGYASILGGTETPEDIARNLYSDHDIGDGSVSTMWELVQKAMDNRRTQQRVNPAEAQAKAQFDEFESATKKGAGKQKVSAGSLNVGDHVFIAGDRVEVVDVDPDSGDVTLKDGRKFGIQQIADGQNIYVEKLERAETSAAEDPFATDEPPAPPPDQSLPSRSVSTVEEPPGNTPAPESTPLRQDDIKRIAAQAETAFLSGHAVKPEGLNLATKEGKAWKAQQSGKKGLSAVEHDKARRGAMVDAVAQAHAESTPLNYQGIRLRTDRFGKQSIVGTVDPSRPFDAFLIRTAREAGRWNDQTQGVLDDLQNRIGQTVAYDYGHAPESESVVTQAGRSAAQKAASARMRARGEADMQVERKQSVPLGVAFNKGEGSFSVFGASPEKLLSNFTHVAEAVGQLGEPAPYRDIHDPHLVADIKQVIANHENGWKGDGSGPIKASSVPELGLRATPGYKPQFVIPKERFDFLNMMFGDESAKAQRGGAPTPEAKAKLALAAENQTLIADDGETNELRHRINQKLGIGEWGKVNAKGEPQPSTWSAATIENPLSENIAPDLVMKVHPETSREDASLRQHGYAGEIGRFFDKGTPNRDFAASGFMPAEEAGAKDTTKARAAQLWKEKGTDSPFFRQWFGGSKVVGDEGKPLVAKHGTARPDRVGNIFRKSRATSGPMAFFTSGENSGDVASGYATGKSDTSLEDFADYSEWFKYKPKGSRSEIPIDRAWWHLTPEQKQTATERLYTVGRENPQEGEGKIVPDSQSIMGNDSIDYELRQARGNALRAAVEIWLNSGSLFGGEEEFMDVLKGMGIEGARMDHPHQTNPAVYPVYLKIENPLVSTAIPDSVMTALQRAANRQRAPRQSIGADAWDKNTRDPQEWMNALREDSKNGTTHAWTSIPDWVTKTLRAFGYDGIQDKGGKYHDAKHDVWVPFDETQVKSATGNQGTFDPSKRDIRFMPDTGKTGESDKPMENLAREAEDSGVVLSLPQLKGLMADDEATKAYVRRRIEQQTGRPAKFQPKTPTEKRAGVPVPRFTVPAANPDRYRDAARARIRQRELAGAQ